MNKHSQAFGSNQEFHITPPEVPKDWTLEHIAILNDIFGKKNLEPRILPTVDDFSAEDDREVMEKYFDMMYPKDIHTPPDGSPKIRTHPYEQDNGLISLRLIEWHSGDAIISGLAQADEFTWGDVYMRSMREELEDIGGKVVFMETLQKPHHYSFDSMGRLFYGDLFGGQPQDDPLLAVFCDAFGPNTTRLWHSWESLTTKVIPRIEKNIQKQFMTHGKTVPPFKVMILPALLNNLDVTLYHPKQSQAKMSEWASDIVKNKDGQDRGIRMNVGSPDSGGASGIGLYMKDAHSKEIGVRFAVVLG